jgi:hypothetical protein
MIVLDEQLLRFDLEIHIREWYPGAVRFITDLRPDTVIKDDGIPALLRSQRQATFVTINESDFWRKISPDRRFCVVCFALPSSRAHEINNLLRSLFRRREFNTKSKRMGHVIYVAPSGSIRYYTVDPAQFVTILA